MTATDLAQEHAQFITRVQRLCRSARDAGGKAWLDQAADLMNSDQFKALPYEAQEDLSEAYARAAQYVTGAGGG